MWFKVFCVNSRLWNLATVFLKLSDCFMPCENIHSHIWYEDSWWSWNSMHIIVASTIFNIEYICKRSPDLKAIFGPSFFNQNAILFTIYEGRRFWAHFFKIRVQKIPQSHTADHPTTPWGRDTEHLQPHDSKKTIKIKQSALSPLAEWLQN